MAVKIKITPQNFFLNLLIFAALYASVVSFLALIFSYVNVLFPDQLNYYENYTGEIITPSSVLIVIFPVFILASWLLSRDWKLHPGKKEMPFRKWLIYLTLFIAAITIMVDLITLISSFYHGELTARFTYKVLAVLLTAAGVFAYYFLDLKNSAWLKPKFSAWLASVIVMATIVAGFLIVGTPVQQRARRFDERRVNDLQTIQSQLLNYWVQKEQLPEDLSELTKDQLSGFILPTDPETGLNYTYHKLTAFSFELCAEFKRSSAEIATGALSPDSSRQLGNPVSKLDKEGLAARRPGQFREQDAWSHGLGETCFERTIDPEIYKTRK